MHVHFGLEGPASYRRSVLSIGNFDGVHLGHRTILTRLVERARASGCQSSVLTFEPHPIQLLRPHQIPPRLTTIQDKCQLILQSGVDHVIVYPTDQNLLNLTADEFFDRIVVEHFQASGMVEGPNFYFGKGRSGDIAKLTSLCERQSMSLDVLQPSLLETLMISSSAIRASLEAGDVHTAAEQLGRHYSISGIVAHGDQRGRTIGFPTANLDNVSTMLPADGVYAALAHLQERTFPAAVNIGPNPTFGKSDRKIEAHLIEFSGESIYGESVRLEFVSQVRSVKTFKNVDQLKDQITHDVAHAAKIIGALKQAT